MPQTYTPAHVTRTSRGLARSDLPRACSGNNLAQSGGLGCWYRVVHRGSEQGCSQPSRGSGCRQAKPTPVVPLFFASDFVISTVTGDIGRELPG